MGSNLGYLLKSYLLYASTIMWVAITPRPPPPTHTPISDGPPECLVCVALPDSVRGYVGNSENFVKIWWWFFHLPQLANLRSWTKLIALLDDTKWHKPQLCNNSNVAGIVKERWAFCQKVLDYRTVIYVRVPPFHVVDGFKGGQTSEGIFIFVPYSGIKSESTNFFYLAK